jgi:transcriptional regulator with XRE-family HTH domain
MNYGEKLKELREYNNLSQSDVAKSIGISRSAYNQFEQQYDIIPIKRLNDVANFFNCSVDYILGLSNNKKYLNSKKDIDINISKERLRIFRKEHKLTQDKLAKILETTQSVVAGFERGRNFIATPFLYTICKKYNISADYLLGKIDTPKELS